MLRIGLSEVAGFWKIIAMRRPRISASRLSDCVSRSSPSNITRPATIFAGGGARRSNVRLETVLPLPDSPTMPSVWPDATWKSTPSTARTTPSRVWKWTLSPSTASSGAGSAADTGIERIGETVGQEVEAQHGHEDRSPRHQARPRRHLQGLVVEEQHLSPGYRLRIAEAQEAHHRLGEDRTPDAQRHQHDQRRQRVGQDVAKQDLARRGADAARRLDELGMAQPQELGPCHARNRRPGEQPRS